MICIAISDTAADDCLQILDRVEMAEIRIDLNNYTAEEIRKIFGHRTQTIATCRPDRKGYDYQLEMLTLAMNSGAGYVDIEIEAPTEQREALLQVAKSNNCRVIISYHNFETTPGLRELYQLTDECYSLGADVAKIAVMTRSKADSARVLSLYSTDKPVVALGMGDAGRITRIVAPLLGAEFTFASMDNGKATAPGQISLEELKEVLHLLNKFA